MKWHCYSQQRFLSITWLQAIVCVTDICITHPKLSLYLMNEWILTQESRTIHFMNFQVNVKLLQLNRDIVLKVCFLICQDSPELLGSKLKCVMMTSRERANRRWCIWMLMCLHICLDGVTVNDDTAFLTHDTFRIEHLPETCGYSSTSQQQQTSIIRSHCVSGALSHPMRGLRRSLQADTLPQLWGDCTGVCVRDEANKCGCIVFISSSHSLSISSIL